MTKKGKRRGIFNTTLALTLKNPAFWQIWGDDGRKVGLASAVAGLLGLFTKSAKFSTPDSLLLLLFGLLTWILSVILYSM